jgi:putative transposase
MRQAGIRGVSRRRKRGSTRRDPRSRPAPDLVDRHFQAGGPNQLWVSDIKTITTGTGPLHLAVVTDVWSRRVVGWSLRATIEARLVVEALTMAITQRNPPPGLVFHSDQGAQYTSIEVTELAATYGILRSMGSVGDCYDNALAESLFATLQTEFLAQHTFRNRNQATQAIFSWIEGWYNTKRRHSSLGNQSPANYERNHWPTKL